MGQKLTVAEAAEHLGMSQRFIRDSMYGGRLPYLKFGSAVRIDTDVLAAFEQAHVQPATVGVLAGPAEPVHAPARNGRTRRRRSA